MSLRHEIRHDAHDAADAFLDGLAKHDAGLKRFPRPIDVIAAKCGLEVALVSKDVCDLEHGCSALRTIVVASDQKPWQRRLTVGHEIAHYELNLMVVGDAVVEQECTAFAAGLLMPMEDVIASVASLVGRDQRTPEEWAEEEHRTRVMTDLVRHYGVGYKALLVAMGDYGLVTGVEPWHAVWQARDLMDTYYDRWNLLRGITTSSD